MKQIVTIGTALAIGTLLGSYWATGDAAGSQLKIENVQLLEVAQLKTQNANLLQENSSLRQQLTTALDIPQQQTLISKPSTAITKHTRAGNKPSQVENTLKSKMIANKITTKINNHIQDMSSTLAQEFNNESINYEWAEAEQQKLSNWFSNNAEFSGLALQSVNCRSTQCKISVAANTHAQANDIFLALSHALKDQYASSLYYSDTDLSKNTTALYISFTEADSI